MGTRRSPNWPPGGSRIMALVIGELLTSWDIPGAGPWTRWAGYLLVAVPGLRIEALAQEVAP